MRIRYSASLSVSCCRNVTPGSFSVNRSSLSLLRDSLWTVRDGEQDLLSESLTRSVVAPAPELLCRHDSNDSPLREQTIPNLEHSERVVVAWGLERRIALDFHLDYLIGPG